MLDLGMFKLKRPPIFKVLAYLNALIVVISFAFMGSVEKSIIFAPRQSISNTEFSKIVVLKGKTFHVTPATELLHRALMIIWISGLCCLPFTFWFADGRSKIDHLVPPFKRK